MLVGVFGHGSQNIAEKREALRCFLRLRASSLVSFAVTYRLRYRDFLFAWTPSPAANPLSEAPDYRPWLE